MRRRFRHLRDGQTAAPTDEEILNFALNLEYLEAQFYTYATTGSGLPASMPAGVGTQGTVMAGAQVPFQDPRGAGLRE